jgi:uncharacterized protein YoxC
VEGAVLQILQWAFGLCITIILLYLSMVMKNFARTIDRLDTSIERLNSHILKTTERLARLETLVER